jgi:ABC-type Mn2+/Zn2+ transport system permease subunit
VVLALALAWLGRRRELAGGAAVAIVLAACLALGAVLVSDIADPGVSANGLLFGSLLAIGWDEVARTAIVAATAVAATAAASRRLSAATFHEELAAAEGLRPGLLEAGLMALLAATVAVGLAAVGSLLVASILLVPSATALLLANRVMTVAVAGVAVAAFDGVAGLIVAFHLDAPPGAGIAAVAAMVYVAAAAATAVRRRRRTRQLIAVPT